MEEQGLPPNEQTNDPPDGNHPPDDPGYTRDAGCPGAGDGSPALRTGPPCESPSFLRGLWPIVLLLAISAATAIVVAAAPDGKGESGVSEKAAEGIVEGIAEELAEEADEETDEEPASPVEIVLNIFALGFLGAGILCLLLLLDPRVRRRLLPPPREAPRATWGSEQLFYGFLLAFATLVLVSACARLVPEDSRLIGTLVQAAGQLAIAAMVVALVLTRPTAFPHLFGPNGPAGTVPVGSARERLASLGISGRNAGANALRGVVAVTAAFPLAVGAGWLGRLIHEAVTGEAPGLHPVIKRVAEAGAVEVAVLVGVACVAAPLFEELFFRGFLYPSIRDRFGVAAGAVASSLVFAMVHPDLPNQMATFVLGVAFCLVYERAGTLVAPVIAHAIFNGIQLAFVLVPRAAG